MKLQTKQLAIKTGDKIICQQLNLSIKTGEFWGVLGPNGSGKTSLLHTLSGLQPAYSGEICIDDNKLSRLSPRAVAKQLAVLFQDIPVFFSQTVWEFCLTSRFPHLPYFKKESEQDREIVENALEIMELTHLKQQPVTKLSGGEKRRLAIASTLAQTPDIFILDEPTNHLDVRHQINALRHFRYLADTQSKTIVASLHDMNLAQQFCHRMLLLFHDGHVIQGIPQDVMTTENLTRLYQQPIKKISNENTTLWWPE